MNRRSGPKAASRVPAAKQDSRNGTGRNAAAQVLAATGLFSDLPPDEVYLWHRDATAMVSSARRMLESGWTSCLESAALVQLLQQAESRLDRSSPRPLGNEL